MIGGLFSGVLGAAGSAIGGAVGGIAGAIGTAVMDGLGKISDLAQGFSAGNLGIENGSIKEFGPSSTWGNERFFE